MSMLDTLQTRVKGSKDQVPGLTSDILLLFPLRDGKDLMEVTARTVQQLTLVELVEVMSAKGYWQKLMQCPICEGSVRVNDIGRWTCHACHCEWPGQVVLHGSPFFVARGGSGYYLLAQ